MVNVTEKSFSIDVRQHAESAVATYGEKRSVTDYETLVTDQMLRGSVEELAANVRTI